MSMKELTDMNEFLNNCLDSISAELNSSDTREKVSIIAEKAKSRYLPLRNWSSSSPHSPRNLKEAVIKLETFKKAYINVYGEY